ncbi:MAG: alpha/beta hydrolase [Betaproteobacteria bacterium]|nr:alpha/beta hydrolase [Betaproteobacteria bacterium]
MTNLELFPDCAEKTFSYESSTGQVDISYLTGGSGPPLLLLHGFPQTKAIWHQVVPQLLAHFHVIIPDLRGYGHSSSVPSDATHLAYSKRAMAEDQIALMTHLGYRTFSVCGHDRGGRVAHRLALDYPDAVERLMVLDISPTYTMYEKTNKQFATDYWHWFFLIQPYPVPETLINSNPEFWLQQHMDRAGGVSIFDPLCWREYQASINNPAIVHAMCEDYRAAASIDLVHDQINLDENVKLTQPLRVLWGSKGIIETCFNPIADWKHFSHAEVDGRALHCGHYIPEEKPTEVVAEILSFFNY